MMKQWKQIRAVYIYCENGEAKPELFHFKASIVLTSADQLVEKIKIDQRRRQRYEDPISFNCINRNKFRSSTNRSSHSFMIFELLIDVVLRTERTNEMDELIRLCKIEYNGNKVEECRINKFQQTYTAETSIHWFTKDSFVYRLLNKALRLQSIELLLAFRFVIKDIYEQLAKLEQDQNISNIKVYRGQILLLADLGQMTANIGGLISFHSFISTSSDRDQATAFVLSEPTNASLVNVLFEIECTQCSSLSLTPKPYVCVSKLSEISSENEVLISLGSYFRISGIDYDSGIKVDIIKLVSLSGAESTCRSSKEVHQSKSDIFHDLQSAYEEHRKHYQDILKSLSNDESKGLIYILAGNTARAQEEYHLSLEHLQKALDIYCSIDPRNQQLIIRRGSPYS